MNSDISVLLTAFQRPAYFQQQLAAVRAQTVSPMEIVVWHNQAGDTAPFDFSGLSVVTAQPNAGVWPRFLYGLEFSTKYVCIFDDDTVPGRKWFENCLDTIAQHRGLLGTVGLVFQHGNRSKYWRCGWVNANQTTMEVDIVGHSWFFERDWLRYYALEPRCGNKTCGEDYHFSVALQKHLQLPTFVPPHPAADREQWGSIHGNYGKDSCALYRRREEPKNKSQMHARYLDTGWRPLALRKPEYVEKIFGKG